MKKMAEDTVSQNKSERPRLKKAEELEIDQFLKDVRMQEDSSNNTQMDIMTSATLWQDTTIDSNHQRKMAVSKILQHEKKKLVMTRN